MMVCTGESKTNNRKFMMAKFFQRVAEAVAAGRAASQQAVAPALKPPVGIAQRYLLAFILGQSIEEAQATAAALRPTAGEKNLRVVLVTDQSDIAIFQIENCITENLPPLNLLDGKGPKADIEIYLAQRVGILMDKWEPLEVLPFGETSETLYRFWQENNPKPKSISVG